MYKLEMGLGFAAQKFCCFWLLLFISFIYWLQRAQKLTQTAQINQLFQFLSP